MRRPDRLRCLDVAPPLALAAVLAAASLVLGVARAVEAAEAAKAAGRPAPRHLPWEEAGLTERQAAAHLLNRLTFGPRPGEIDRVRELGIEGWIERQLAGLEPEPRLAARLQGLESLELSPAELARTFAAVGRVLREATEAGVLPRDFDPDQAGVEQERYRSRVLEFARRRGYRPERQLLEELLAQKLHRAVYSENQLVEVLTDFWFNHFNVTVSDPQSRLFVLAYERDAIRPHVLGRFRVMLGATARHPAMLLYLDNAMSTAAEDQPTTLDLQRERRWRQRRGPWGYRGPRYWDPPPRPPRRSAQSDRPLGLNENYARELLELHTLGVDGGYSQDDVVEVARAFTGWSVIPPRVDEAAMEAKLERTLGAGLGFAAEGSFIFRADQHDAGAKRILGRRLPSGRGIEDGEQVLDLLARHPSTARHLAYKLAVRFVADEPPEALVERLTATYLRTSGDLTAVMRKLVASPEFWGPQARLEKIKSPLEVAASALRALDAEVGDPRAVAGWIARMGQPLYAYQAPTGYPDHADFWVNTGALLNRMKFGLALAAGQVEGARIDLAALNGGREPESREAALRTYLPLLLPERDFEETLERLGGMIRQPDLAERVDSAAPATEVPPVGETEVMAFLGELPGETPTARRGWPGSPTPLEQVVGVILGSPEFQRR